MQLLGGKILLSLVQAQKINVKEQMNKRALTCPTGEQTISKLQQLQWLCTRTVIDEEIKEQNRTQKQTQKHKKI